MLIRLLRSFLGRPTGRGTTSDVTATDSVRPSLVTAVALTARGEFAAAERVCRQLLAADPENPDAMHLLGTSLHALGRHDDAVEVLRAVVVLEPTNAEAHLHLASALHAGGCLDEGIAVLATAIALNPDLGAAHSAMGAIFRQQGRLEDAAAAFRNGVRCSPEIAPLWCNLGLVVRELEGDAAALACLDRALELAPDFAEAIHLRGQCLLGSGRFAEGWIDLEARFRIPRIAGKARDFVAPRWHGEPLAGKRILVWGEQGVGDELLFASLYADLRERGAECVFECRPKLAALFARSFPWAQVVARDAAGDGEQPAIDFHAPAGGLAMMLRPGLRAFPARTAYLVADSARAEKWRQRLRTLGTGINVGFCWRSSNMAGERAQSCTHLDDWAPLFGIPGVNWICMQYDECASELAEAEDAFGVRLHRFGEVDHYDDLDEVAALMMALDLVITAPTTVSVQAAALGRPTWQFSFGADWQTHGTDCNPWLPAIVRFQRRWNQPWAEIFETLAERLRRLPAYEALQGTRARYGRQDAAPC